MACLVGVVLALGTLGIFWGTWCATGDLDLARTTALTQMVVFQFFNAFNCRSVRDIPLLLNPFLFASVAAAALARWTVLHLRWRQGAIKTQPLSPRHWGLILPSGDAGGPGRELDKEWNRRRARPIG